MVTLVDLYFEIWEMENAISNIGVSTTKTQVEWDLLAFKKEINILSTIASKTAWRQGQRIGFLPFMVRKLRTEISNPVYMERYPYGAKRQGIYLEPTTEILDKPNS